MDELSREFCAAVQQQVQADLDGLGYPVTICLDHRSGGWPLIALVSHSDGEKTVLTEIDREPLHDGSIESRVAVAVHQIVALYDEYTTSQPPNPVWG